MVLGRCADTPLPISGLTSSQMDPDVAHCGDCVDIVLGFDQEASYRVRQSVLPLQILGLWCSMPATSDVTFLAKALHDHPLLSTPALAFPSSLRTTILLI